MVVQRFVVRFPTSDTIGAGNPGLEKIPLMPWWAARLWLFQYSGNPKRYGSGGNGPRPAQIKKN